jgi:uncharacterized protein
VGGGRAGGAGRAAPQGSGARPSPGLGRVGRRSARVVDPPLIRGGTAVRAGALLVGLALFALGIVLQLQSELGLGPWDVLNQGLSERTPLTFGGANIAVAVVVLVLAAALGARIGVGTVANAVLIGTFVDLFLGLEAVDDLTREGLAVRVVLLIAGIGIVAIGSGLYIGAAFGAGPRDSLMLIVARRTGVRIGVVRVALEVTAAALGFALGGTVGIGTVAFALGIGPAVELAFWVLVHLGLADPPPRRATTIADREGACLRGR